MSLNELKRRSLEEKEFDKLLNNKEQKGKWFQLVDNAQTFARQNITQGKQPRVDDISSVLYNIIRADHDFRVHQDTHGAREDYWVEWFTDYVVDRIVNVGRGYS